MGVARGADARVVLVRAMSISVAIVRAIAEGLAHRGITVAGYCARSGLEPARLDDVAEMVSVAEYAACVRAALELTDESAFGLRIGTRAHTGGLHALGYLLLNCRTMRHAIGAHIALSGLVFDGARWYLHEHGERASFGFEQPLDDPEVARFHAELVLSLAARIGRRFAGETPPLEVRFRHPAPAEPSGYRRRFGAAARFDQPRDEILFRRDLLDVPQLCSDERVVELLRERAEQLLGARRAGSALALRVRELIARSAGGAEAVDAAAIARGLGLSVSALRRQLSGAGVSLSQLVAEVRCERARRALRGREPIKQIAAHLGFSEPSAFHRAFKRWTGKTPAQYRDAVDRGSV
jgi:AraC-like DNA-binding protein